MADGTSADIAALQGEVRQLRADLGNLGETLRDLARHGSEEARAKARDSGQKVWEEGRRYAESVNRGIEEKPITAALAAFGVGVFLGALFSSRRS